MQFGLELTFLPKKNPLGFDAETRKSQQILHKFNKYLSTLSDISNKTFVFTAHFDMLNYPTSAIEVNGTPIEDFHIDLKILKKNLEVLFCISKSLNLTGRHSYVKNGTRFEYPTAGGHLHHDINLWEKSYTPSFLYKLNKFERNLYIDYANRPYIRWLFAQWFDNINSRVTLDQKDLPRYGGFKGDIRAKAYGDYAGIRSRFSGFRKGCLPTFEHRYFDATKNAEETLANLRFLRAWVKNIPEYRIKSTLTKKYFRDLKDSRFAWHEISQFLTNLGLQPDTYHPNFERNYITRMKFGHMI